MKCSNSLFNRDINVVVIPKTWDYNNINVLISQILNDYQNEKQSFSLQYDRTTDIDTYISSIDSFIETLLEEIPIQFSEYDRSRIINSLRFHYYPANASISKESENIPITAIIPEADLLSQHDKKEEKINSTLEEFFGNNTLLKSYCKDRFKKDIFGVTVLLKDGIKSQKVTDINSLNQNIENYKNNLYQNIYNYLISRGIKPELKITQLFVQNSNTPQENHKIRKNYTQILDDFYMLITQNPEITQNQLEQDWIKKQTGNRESSLLDAVNSYIHLLYFDELLENSVGNYLGSKSDQDQVIIINPDQSVSYKYNFGETGQMVHGWQTEVRDAVKELGTFSKFLIENIPLKNSNSYMTVIDYYTAMLKLKDHLLDSSIVDNNNITYLRNAMQDFHNHPEEKLKYIFENIMTSDGFIKESVKASFDEDKIDFKMNDNDYLVLESLYDYLYRGNESLYSIETKQLRNKGFDTQYPLLKSIVGAFDSTSAMDYLEIVYDYDAQSYQYRVKKKYASKRDFYDYKDQLNRRVLESGRKVYLDKYKPIYDSSKVMKIIIGDNTYTLHSSSESFGILDGTAGSSIKIIDPDGNILVNNTSLYQYFSIGLNTITQRQKIIDNILLSPKEQQFRELLEFIDDNLGTGFLSDEQGLLKFNLYLGLSSSKSTGFKNLVQAAAKSLEVLNLQNGFVNQSKIDNFKEYLSIAYPYSTLTSSITSKDLLKNYFYTNYKGEFLYAIDKRLKSNEWVDNLIQATRVINGDTTKATTKNLSGDSIPNTSPAFLGREIKQVLSDQNTEHGPTEFLLFNQKPETILGIIIDTDVRTESGQSKNVSAFTTSELLYHNFMNKFVLPMQQGKMIIQPTVYSDKKKFINYMIDIKALLGNVNNFGKGQFQRKITETIGNAYKDLYERVLDDYMLIYPGERSIERINNILRIKSSEDFIKDAQAAGVNVMEDIHYRKKINGGLSVNELLQWYNTLYNDPELLSERLNEEKYKFVQSLSNNRVAFEKSVVLVDALSKVGNANDWFDKGLMVIAKITEGGETKNIIYGEQIPPTAQINPLLERYFYLHDLLANNLKLSLIGSELNHKVKSLGESVENLNATEINNGVFTKEEKNLITKAVKLPKTSKFNFVDIKNAIDKNITAYEGEKVATSPEWQNIFDKYKKEIYKVESAEQNAQLKRTVPVPGTMRYFLQDTLDGIASTIEGAVIEDVGAEIYQFSGKQDKPIDAHDGSALIDPLTSILENNSLQDSEVGTIKKTLLHDFNTPYMSAVLLKYAQHTITNEWMRQSENSKIKLYDMFKKMADSKRWDESEIPDITRMAYHKNIHEVDFATDILQGNKLFYKIGRESRRIENFGKDNIGYYTEEYIVNSYGDIDTEFPKTKYYHFFDDSGHHYRIKDGNPIPQNELGENLDTINSLFRLHAALGGIYSMSLIDGQLQYSEASNHAVVGFMNNVCVPTNPSVNSKSPRTQTNFRQPLKTKIINYLLNQSSIKNGAQNINKSSVYWNNAPLRSFTIKTSRYGIQQDSDHEADEARMTEFSQVISSLDAGGHYHNYVKQVYEVLGKVALEASASELEGVKSFIDSQLDGKSREQKIQGYEKLYEIVGKTLINNISTSRGQAGLSTALLLALKKEFNMTVNHYMSKHKIPFSDPNIYSQLISTLASTINKKSIKREYPGNGMVMSPGYGMCQVWDLDGKVLQFKDILKMVDSTPQEGESISDANRRAVKTYLDQRQQEIPFDNNPEAYYPSDVINIYYKVGEQQSFIPVELSSMEDYQNFINNTKDFINNKLSEKEITQATLVGFQKNITQGRDLAPAKVTYKYRDPSTNEVKSTNIFASYVYRDIYGNPTREQKQRIQKFLNNLDTPYTDESGTKYRGFIYLSEEDELANKKTGIFDFKNTPAETILSNIYQSKFGLSYYDSINDVQEESFQKPIKTNFSEIADLAFVKGNGKNLYISINNSEERKIKSWKNISKENSVVNGQLIHNIFVTTEDNIKLFQIGRELKREGYTFQNDKFYNEKGEQVVGEFSFDGENVWEYIEFVENSQASLENGKNFRFYNINQDKLRRAFIPSDKSKFEDELREFTGRIVKSIYNSDSYEIIIPNNKIKTPKLSQLSSLFKSLANQTKENQPLQEYLNDISGLLSGLSFGKNLSDITVLRNKKIGNIKYQDRIQQYVDQFTHKKYISFQKSKDFTSSRIPAQTLQSFMYMQCVGYTGVHTNQAFVSHFQTYLQGSDYDIDKSYMLGHEFDDNGIYLGWSNLFDYTNIDTLHASENLPYPQGRVYIKTNNGIDINSYAQAINSTTGVRRINNIVRLLDFLNNQDNLNVSYNGNDDILDLINRHESTYIAPINRVPVMKNFVSSHIQKQIQGVRNMMAAYSPIEMDDMHEASIGTPKEKEASQLTMMNPAMIAIMQRQNMVGKNVVGIAANGQKANLNWNYYINDVIRNGSEKDLSRATFSFKSNRIMGRYNGIPNEVEINGLPDTNWDGVTSRIRELFGNILQPKISTDLMGSQVISAATDNAKELILDKINSGQQTAKCYLYLISLGFDIKDIVKFMTSPAVSFIEENSQENIFSGYFGTLETVANGLLYPKKNSIAEKFLQGKSDLEIQEIKADAREFLNILEGANEFSNLGKGLGINQGVPTTKEDLVGWKRFFTNIIRQREQAIGLIDKNGTLQASHPLAGERIEFNFDAYLADPNYRESVIDYYDKIKHTSNVLAIMDYIPHFKAMFEMLGVLNTMDSNISLKSKLNNYYMNEAYQKYGKNVRDDTANKINRVIDILLIQNYISQKGFTIPTKSGWTLLGSRYERIPAANSNLTLGNPTSIASFKFIFEQYIIPELQSGKYFTNGVTLNDGTELTSTEVNNLVKNNDFIKGLVSGRDGDKPIYKLNIDMLTKDSNPNANMQFQKYLDGFIQLNNISVNGTSLANWFMLYNLIVNKNNYGSDRMTTLFQEIVKNPDDDYIINDYLDYIGSEDFDKSIFQDIINNNSLSSILKTAARSVKSTNGQQDLFVKIYDSDGNFTFYEKNGSAYSSVPFNGVYDIDDESKQNRTQRIIDMQEYGFGLIGSEYLNQIVEDLKSSWVSAFNQLLEQGFIEYYNKCD